VPATTTGPPDPGVTIRSLGDGELEVFSRLAGPSFGPPGRDFLATARERHYRPEWTWVAERGGRVLARAAWWGAPDDEHPYALDWFDLDPDVPDRVAVGTALLGAAQRTVHAADGAPPEYHLFLPPDWHDRPQPRTSARERIAAARGAGLEQFVERLRVEWEPADGVPARSGRLVLSPVSDDTELVDVLARIVGGTLDAYTRRDLARMPAADVARGQVEDMAWMPAPREWWRLAHTARGDVVGVVMPSRNYQAAVIGYLGVVPEQRGKGYVDDLLAWATAFLVGEGADHILADTDTGNAPMAAAFARAGYRVTARRIVMAATGPAGATAGTAG
jgi:ribosomal protein S18 acetylase RimI-like enzyme